LRDSHGGAIAVQESQIEPAAAEMRKVEGIDVGPEGGAGLIALRLLYENGSVRKSETVVLFNTGGNKYH
jgi:threonine synthase